MSAAEPLLGVEGMTCAYGGIIAVRELSFHVGEGEVIALLGANGAGKSTTLRAISGMRRAQAGAITFCGQRIERWSSDRIARLGMALVPEGRRLFTELSVEENLRMGGIAIDRAAVDARVAEACEVFPILASRRHQRAGTLSGGEQQQLAIARALISQPKLLIIDEMSLGLSPLVVAELYRTVREINKTGTAVLIVEQQVALALKVAQRVYLMERGQVEQEGPAKKFRDLSHVTGAYLGGGGASEGRVAVDDAKLRATEVVKLPLRPGQARALQRLASSRGEDVGEIVAKAIDTYLKTAQPVAKNGARTSPSAPRGAARARRVAAGSGSATPRRAKARSSEPPSPPSPARSRRRRPG